MAWVSTTGVKLDTTLEVAALDELVQETGLQLESFVDRPFGDLAGLLSRHKPDVFHFVGHGSQVGDLIMSDANGGAHPVAAADLARSLRALDGGGVTGVVLNACYSGHASHALAPRGGWVVAMDSTIADDAAIEFTKSFYSALLGGSAPATATSAALAHLALAGYSSSDLAARLLPGRGYGYWKSRKPRDDNRNRGAINHVSNVFRRAAFRTPAIQEASYADLNEALDHTALALGTGQLVTRLAPTDPYSMIPPHLFEAPALRALSGKVAPLLDQARGVLARLNRLAADLSANGAYLFAYNDLRSAGQEEDANQFLHLMDEMDEVRNLVMRDVNKALTDHDLPTLPLIQKSSEQI